MRDCGRWFDVLMIGTTSALVLPEEIVSAPRNCGKLITFVLSLLYNNKKIRIIIVKLILSINTY